MAGLAGLSPLVGFVNEQPQATAEERHGGTADPAHGRGQVAQPERMPWEIESWALTPSSPSIDPGLPDEIGDASAPAGVGTLGTPYYDATPYRTHAAPWPKGVETTTDPDAVARQLVQSAEIHASNMGGSQQHLLTIAAVQDEWHEDWNAEAESPTLQSELPSQVAQAAGGYGSTDRVGNPRGINKFGFQNAHLHRRYATGSVPGNYMWMKPAGRPMVKTVAGPARPAIGDASPFTGQDLTLAFGLQGAVLQVAAADYEAPPDPYTAPPMSQQQLAAPGSVALW